MTRPTLLPLAVLLLGSGLALAALPLDAPPDAPKDAVPLRRGMTDREVRDALGPPQAVARQILYRRHLEQWLYDKPVPRRIVFDCPRGQQPAILTVHPLTQGKL